MVCEVVPCTNNSRMNSHIKTLSKQDSVFRLQWTARTDQLTATTEQICLLTQSSSSESGLSVFFRLPPPSLASLHTQCSYGGGALWRRWRQHYYFFPPYSAVAYRHSENFFSIGDQKLNYSTSAMSFNGSYHRIDRTLSATRQQVATS